MPINSFHDLRDALKSIKPNTEIIVETTDGIFNLTTVKRPDGNASFIGISGPYQTYYEPKNRSLANYLNFIMMMLTWIFALNLGIGIVNLLPIKPLDGGLIFEAILKRFFKNGTSAAIKIVSFFMAAVLVFNILGPLVI